MSNSKCLLTIAILACFACSALAIKCYQCDSRNNYKCGEKFKSEDAIKFDCVRNNLPRILRVLIAEHKDATGCMKRTLEDDKGHPVIERTCYFGDIADRQTDCKFEPSTWLLKDQISCDVCTDDLCNSSTLMAPLALTIVAFIVLARLFS